MPQLCWPSARLKPWDSQAMLLTGQPGPMQNVERRVVVPLQREATHCARVPTVCERLGCYGPASAARLARAGRMHRDHHKASFCRFALEDGEELCPPGITDTLGQ